MKWIIRTIELLVGTIAVVAILPLAFLIAWVVVARQTAHCIVKGRKIALWRPIVE